MNNKILIEQLSQARYVNKFLQENHKIISNNIVNELRDVGRVNLVDRRLKTLDDFTSLCKMFRDTRYETLRIVFCQR